MTGSQYDAWVASQIDQAAQEDDTDPRERVQPADETQDEEWQAFLAEQAEAEEAARWSGPAWLAYVEREAAAQCGEAV
jgi:hypothetical protein